jgi:group I intron endonuclease
MKKTKSGVYFIGNKVNGKIYIGSSFDMDKRWINHRHELNRQKHHSLHLQRSYNKYGIEAFEFNIIEYSNPIKDELLECEQKWIDFYTCYEPKYGYNILAKAHSSLGFKHTEESKKKIGLRSKGQQTFLGLSHTDNAKKMIGDSSRGRKGYWRGKKISIEARTKQSISMKGRYSGEKSYKAKTTEAEVLKMRELYASGKRICDIVKMFTGSNWGRVDNIVKRVSWQHI